MSLFNIDKKIGKGLFSKVYSALNEKGQKVALKVISKKNFVRVESIHKIIIEKEIMKILKHVNILKLYRTFQSKSKIYFELEYADLGSLLRIINKKLIFSIQEIQFLAFQIIRGISYMHQKGIVYGDLKAENILINSKGRIKLCDFNLSGTECILAD